MDRLHSSASGAAVPPPPDRVVSLEAFRRRKMALQRPPRIGFGAAYHEAAIRDDEKPKR